jgi:hypothetical protein
VIRFARLAPSTRDCQHSNDLCTLTAHELVAFLPAFTSAILSSPFLRFQLPLPQRCRQERIPRASNPWVPSR